MVRMQRRGLLAAGVGAVALLVPGAVVSGQTPTPPPFVPPAAGTLQLHLGASDYFQYRPPGSTEPVLTQALTGSCPAQIASSPALVSLAPTGGSLGLVADGIGVRASGEGGGQKCGQVNGSSQALTLSLGSALSGKLISFAELDIEGKFDAVVQADLYLGGRNGTLVGTETLPTGNGSDSGPDSADGDNYRWRVPASPSSSVLFDTIVLRLDPTSPANGAFSLEGGADGTVAGELGSASTLPVEERSDSLFQLVEITGLLDCETQPNGEPNTATVGGAGDPLAALTRGFNADCELIPFVLRTGFEGTTQFTELLKDLGDQVGANFFLDIDWEPEATPAAGQPVPLTQIDFDGAGGAGPQTVQFCGGTPTAPVRPAGVLWCLVSQSISIAGGDTIQISERYFGAEDPKLTR